MSSTYLTGAYPTGYTLSGVFSTVTIGSTASVGGAGVVANILATIVNVGTIDGSTGDGIALDSGGGVDNKGFIEATATTGVGVYLDAGGHLSNSVTGAMIEGGYDGVAVRNGRGTVGNLGTISGTTYAGVALGSGGRVTNGTTSDTTALIEGPRGIFVVDAAGTVTNYGTITNSVGSHAAVDLHAGGTVVNGSAADTVALIQGYLGVSDVGTKAGAVTNFGTVTGGFAGVEFFGPTGSVTNGSTSDTAASISGAFGVDLFNGGTLANFGTIDSGAATYKAGVLIDSGTITNGATNDTTARIEGGNGILTGGAIGPTTVTNFGTIQGTGNAVVNGNGTYTGAGVYLVAGGTVTNLAGAVIEDTGSLGIGVELNGAATVVNYGTIASTTGDSVLFKSASDVLAIHAGAAFTGTAEGDGGTLRFAGTGGTASGLGSGTLSGSVSGVFSDFATYAVGSLASWALTGLSTVASGVALDVEGTLTIASGDSLVNEGLVSVGGGFLLVEGSLSGSGTIDVAGGGTVDIFGDVSATAIDFTGPGKLAFGSQAGVSVDGFSTGDTINLQGVAWSSANTVTYSASQHEIIVYDASNVVLQTLDATDVTGTPALQQDGPGTDVVVCFLRGTRILTERGEIAVEDLRPGMRVVTLSGRGAALKPVRWIGRRRLQAARHARPDDVHPIRIMAGALSEHLPHRDLLVSPGHAVSIDGVLMPAFRLVNDVTVIRDRTIAEVEYFHVELEEHDLLLAEGLPAESYYDSGNRRFFENNGGPVGLSAGPDDEHGAATARFRMTNGANGVSEERRRRVERQARRVRKADGTPEPKRRSSGTA